MNGRERFLGALRGEAVDRLAVGPIYMHLYLAARIRREAFQRYDRLMGDREEMAVAPEREVRIRTESYLAAWQSLGEPPDWIWARLLPSTDWLSACTLRREGGRLWRIHRPSGEREDLSLFDAPTESTADRWQRPLPESRAEVDELVPLNSQDELLGSGTLDLVRGLVERVGDRTFVCGTVGQPFWKCYLPLGFHGLMTMPVDRPDLFQYMVERQTQASLAMAHALAEIGVHGVFIEECLTSADLISPRIYDRFVFPYDRILLDELRRLGLPSILYLCGHVVPRLERLVELAPAALAVEESKKGFRIDLAEVAEKVGGMMAVLGNVDATQIKDWDRETLQAQLMAQAQAARPARGFVVSMGSPFPLETPREMVAAFMAAGRSQAMVDHWSRWGGG